ncbi:MAG: helix-turn-helix domain-containing protein [Planctomycetaceae bacterium]|nr:helix-turn-helix domain-containing protein [Planctomycetaceae bacterium]
MLQEHEHVRDVIAANLRNHREQKFPGHGGAKACAEAYGVVPQQWSQWETGRRMPEGEHLRKLALFFDTTVQDLCGGLEPAHARPPVYKKFHHPLEFRDNHIKVVLDLEVRIAIKTVEMEPFES